MSKYTVEQQAAISARGKTIVSASAGSGKTTVMIEKIVRLIKEETSVDSILAVTFTKKAASQMKAKLCKELIEEINNPDCPKEKQIRLKEQLGLVPGADISTIHSFCAKLIRTHFYVLGVENTFRVISDEDAEGTALKNQALDELFEQGYESKEEDFFQLLSAYWRKKSDNALREIFHATYKELRNRADYREYLENSKDGYTKEKFEEICCDLKLRLDERCEYFIDLLEDERIAFTEMEECGEKSKNQLALCQELIAWLEDVKGEQDYFSACLKAKPKFSVNKGTQKDTPGKKEHIARLKYLKDKITKTLDDLREKTGKKKEELSAFLNAGKTAKAFAKYLLLFDENYTALKKERGALDYNDLEHYTLALLANEEVQKDVREKYSYVFVDEYQDVNPVQEEIISKISDKELFLVGDIKQAIYGFRGSKSRFFAEKQKEFEEGEGKNLFLTRNFRSSDAVLDLVNKQFSLLMTPRICAVDYARDSIMERGGRYALNSGFAQIHYFGKEEREKAEERGVYSVKERTREKESSESRVAKRIRQIIEEERKKKYYDPDIDGEDKWREVRYSDIAILSRKKKGQIATTVASLAAEGIPVTATAAVNICEYAEVKTLIDILSLLDNAEQDVPLCSALLSTMGGLIADDLTEIRLSYPKELYFRNACKLYAEEQKNPLSEKLNAFYRYFNELRKLRSVMDTAELLTKILSETRMETTLLSRENGVSCLNRIHRFVEEAATESLCVHEFLRRLKDLDYKIEYNENGGEDSVKVFTMHASKGLEYPIVILDNLSASFAGPERDEVFVEEKYGLAPRSFEPKKRIKSNTLLRRLHLEKEEQSSISDALNLYYVALTRAKYGIHLLFEERTPLAIPKYARSFADFTDFSVWEEYEEEFNPFDIPKQERVPLAFCPDEELAQKIMRAFTWQYAYSGYEDLPVKSSATELLPKLQKDFSLSEQTTEEKKTSTDLGTAYHAFLEKFDFDLLYTESGEKRTAEELEEQIGGILEGWKDKAEYELLSLPKLVEILSNPVFYDLKGKTLYKEQQFLVSLPVAETYALKEGEENLLGRTDGEEMLFQGAIDLLAVGEDEILIIDYKYSQKNAEYLRGHYARQLDLYRKAVAKIMQVDIRAVQCKIVNIFYGFQVDLE